MAVSQEGVEALIDGIYEAALAPERWADVLAATGRLINSTSASALWFDGQGTVLLRGDGWNVDPEAMDLYRRHYVSICPRLRLSESFDVGDCYDDRAVRARAGEANRAYYAFVDANGHGLARTLLAEKEPNLRMGLNFYGPAYDDPGGEVLRVLKALVAHVRRASHLTLRLSEAEDRARFGEDLFEMSSAMLLLDGQARVRRLNGRAQAVLALKDGLQVAGGHLHAARASDDVRLQREIGTALAPRAGRPVEGMALVSRPSGRPAWAVSAIPVPLQTSDGRVPSRVLVTVAETVPSPSPARLRRAWGLSPAEAAIAAALAEGRHPEEIAQARGASLETVRAQLKSVFSKLEVSTQAQLVGRVASLCGLPSPPPDG